MKCVALAALSIAGASAGSLDFSKWSDCGGSAGKISDLKPVSLPLGKKTTVTAAASLTEAVTAGTYSIQLTAGAIKQTFPGDICTSKTFQLPLGTGSISWDGLKCPVAVGNQDIPIDVLLSASIPSLLQTGSIHVTVNVGSGTVCLDIPFKPASLDGSVDPEQLFEEFGKALGRVYTSTEERDRRLAVFSKNLDHIEKMQITDAEATYSHMSPFADWTVEEFSALNTLKPSLLDTSNIQQGEWLDTSVLPDSFDWVAKGAVNEVKNQGQCGSCWAFSTIANIEGVNFVKTQKLVSLSEQELVDCDHTGPDGDQGCQGGLPSNAFKWLIANKTGLEAETTYSYTGRDGSCKAQKADELVFISSWKQIPSDEAQMAAALVQYGPLSIGINAGPMQWYMGGIANPWSILCNPKSIDHGVAIVGFGSQPKDYWTIRNSWGASWGEKGYYRIVRGVNKCGLNTMPTTAVIGGSGIVVV
jgi:cathepsin F